MTIESPHSSSPGPRSSRAVAAAARRQAGDVRLHVRARQYPPGCDLQPSYCWTMTKADLARTAKPSGRARTQTRNQTGLHSGREPVAIAKGAGQDVLKVNMPGAADDFTVGMDMNVAPGGLRLTSYVDSGASASFVRPGGRGAGDVRVPGRCVLAASWQPTPTDPCADRDSSLTGTWVS